MEYEKIINLFDNTPNAPSKFRTKRWVEINDKPRRTYNPDSQIKFKTSNLRSSLCNYSDAYILVNRTITITGARADDVTKWTDEKNEEGIFKNCAPFIECTGEINRTQIDYARDLNVAMSMYNLIEYSNNYSKTSGSLWKYYRDEANATLTDSESFRFKVRITGKNPCWW